MKLAQYCVGILGAVLVAVGYFRKSRNLMLVGTIVLFVSTGLPDMVRGAVEGWKDAR